MRSGTTTKRMARYLPRLGTLTSSALIVLAMPPVEWSFLVFVGLLPWFFSLKGCKTLSSALLQSLWLNILLGFGGAFWVALGTQRYLSVGAPAGALALLLHSLVHQGQLVLFGMLFWKALRAAAPQTLMRVLGLASLYTGLDWVTPKLFHDSLGMILYAYPELRHLAALGGVPLLTFAVALVNLASYSWLTGLIDRKPEDGFAAMAGPSLRLVLPFAGFVLLGSFQLAQTKEALKASSRSLRVGFVQGNIDNALRRRVADADPDAARTSLERYLSGTQRLSSSPETLELIVWPEASYPGIFRKPENEGQLTLNLAFDRFIADLAVPIAFGAYDREDSAGRRRLRNALYLVTPTREQPAKQLSPMQVYHKATLFPVGEYFPMLDEATVRRWLPNSTHLSSGDGPSLLELSVSKGGPVLLGPSICYEDVSATHARSLAMLGADLLINISNDSWFGDHGAARWHLIAAALRSVETGLPQVRATNSGYSAFILPTGELHELTRFDESAERSFELPLVSARPTLTVRFGDWFGPLALLFAIVWLAAHWLSVFRALSSEP